MKELKKQNTIAINYNRLLTIDKSFKENKDKKRKMTLVHHDEKEKDLLSSRKGSKLLSNNNNIHSIKESRKSSLLKMKKLNKTSVHDSTQPQKKPTEKKLVKKQTLFQMINNEDDDDLEEEKVKEQEKKKGIVKNSNENEYTPKNMKHVNREALKEENNRLKNLLNFNKMRNITLLEKPDFAGDFITDVNKAKRKSLGNIAEDLSYYSEEEEKEKEKKEEKYNKRETKRSTKLNKVKQMPKRTNTMSMYSEKEKKASSIKKGSRLEKGGRILKSEKEKDKEKEKTSEVNDSINLKKLQFSENKLQFFNNYNKANKHSHSKSSSSKSSFSSSSKKAKDAFNNLSHSKSKKSQVKDKTKNFTIALKRNVSNIDVREQFLLNVKSIKSKKSKHNSKLKHHDSTTESSVKYPHAFPHHQNSDTSGQVDYTKPQVKNSVNIGVNNLISSLTKNGAFLSTNNSILSSNRKKNAYNHSGGRADDSKDREKEKEKDKKMKTTSTNILNLAGLGNSQKNDNYKKKEDFLGIMHKKNRNFIASSVDLVNELNYLDFKPHNFDEEKENIIKQIKENDPILAKKILNFNKEKVNNYSSETGLLFTQKALILNSRKSINSGKAKKNIMDSVASLNYSPKTGGGKEKIKSMKSSDSTEKDKSDKDKDKEKDKKTIAGIFNSQKKEGGSMMNYISSNFKRILNKFSSSNSMKKKKLKINKTITENESTKRFKPRLSGVEIDSGSIKKSKSLFRFKNDNNTAEKSKSIKANISFYSNKSLDANSSCSKEILNQNPQYVIPIAEKLEEKNTNSNEFLEEDEDKNLLDDEEEMRKRILMKTNKVYDSLSDEEEDELAKIQEDKFLIFSDSIFKVFWDFFLILILIYSVFCVPLSLAFEYYIENPLIAICDSLVDFFMLFDILIKFFVPYVSFDEILIKNLNLIAINYLKSNFFIDFLCGFPCTTIYSICLYNAKFLKFSKITENNAFVNHMNSYNSLGALNTIKLISCCFRIIKLNKLLKNITKEYFDFMEKETTFTVLLRFYFWFFLCTHISSCLFIYCGFIEHEKGWIFINDYLEDSNYSVYIHSLYFHWTTVFTIGYGDILVKSIFERIYNIFLMLVGIAVYSYTVSSLGNLLSKQDIVTKKYNKNLDILNELKLHYNLNDSYYNKVRKYLYYDYKNNASERYKFVEELPRNIMKDLLLNMHKSIITSLPTTRKE